VSTALAAAGTRVCSDPVALNLWHPIGTLSEMVPGEIYTTVLLGEPVCYGISADGCPRASRAPRAHPRRSEAAGHKPEHELGVRESFGYVWASYGSPGPDLFDLAEFAEPDRHNVWAGSVSVHTSAPRAVENFLDMGHFPYVHSGYLGIEPRTEVKDYDVEITAGAREIIATRCEFYQPIGALNADGGMMMEYVYRVPHPYCAILYKSSPIDETRSDAIAIFCQPLDEVNTRAHMLLSLLDDENDDRLIKRFQLLIFGQDKPILENQRPRRLPLSARAETPIRSDKTSIFYRRWLTDMGLTYCVIR